MKHEAIIYFDGPLSKWRRGGFSPGTANYPEPDKTEVVLRRKFRWRRIAEVWAIGQTSRLSNLQYEIRLK